MNSNLETMPREETEMRTEKVTSETVVQIRFEIFTDTLDELGGQPINTEKRLLLLREWYEVLELALDAFDNNKPHWTPDLMVAFENAVTAVTRSPHFMKVFNSAAGIANMLTFIHQLRATRAGLCGVIHVALREIAPLLDQLTVQLEKEKEIEAIVTELMGWKIGRLRAFRTVITENSPE